MRLTVGLFGAAQAKIFFEDTFASLDGWVPSEWKSSSEMGKFELKAGEWSLDPEEDKGLYTSEDSRFYGISKNFEKEFSNKDVDNLVIQYQAKYDKDLECGGGYIKVGPALEDQTKFGDPTPYNIMFGPDKCGYTKRTHLIFNYKGENLLKKTDLPYKQDDLKHSTLYRLVISKDNSVKVEINQEEVYSGKLADDWKFLKEKEIEDPEDKKPSDWVDDPMMADPEAKKPDDYVDAEEIDDPEAKQPEDWDSEEDGEWEAPKIPNPHGYPWTAPQVSNPDYKGPFQPKKIANPEYVDDDQLYSYDKFGFIGFDLWQVKGGSLFDNIIITDDVAEADKFAEKWKALNDHEKEQKKSEEKKDDEKKDDDKKDDVSVDADDDVDDEDL